MSDDTINDRDALDPQQRADDQAIEAALRPSGFDEFVGQEKVVENLKIFIEATRQRDEALDHVLLYGPPGLGKTTLANIVALELGVDIKTTSGPVLDKAGDLAGILTNLFEKDVLFIDEIHRLNNVVEEYLYSAMEDYKLDIMIDRGANARTVQISLPKFTLVGATTRAGLLTAPMRARFGVVLRLDYYHAEALYHIIKRSAGLLKVEIDDDGAMEIARRSRGTPRVANRLLRRTRDFAQVKANGKITCDVADKALKMLEVDELGLDDMDKRIIRTIIEKYNGGPVGLNTIAVAVGEESDTIEEIYEPFLIQEGFVKRTPRGRVATQLAYEHLNYKSQGKMDSKPNFFEDESNIKYKLADFRYELPKKQIAQYPLEERENSRMMVLDRRNGDLQDRVFKDMLEYVNPGDCLVVNNTRVFPARLMGTKDKTGAKVEVFLLRNLENGIWEVMVKPARKVRLGNKIVFSDDFSCDIIDNTVSGGRIVEVHCNGNFFDVLDRVGKTPLPPYVKRQPEEIDRLQYQTVYAEKRGAVAAPTAGLHFTKTLLKKLAEKNVNIAPVTLHVGMGTFKPVQVDDISRHQMHSEYYEISSESAEMVNRTHEKGKKVIAVGTTSVRVLETVAGRNGKVRPAQGWTDKFIFPPHQFRIVDHLITNFHLPESTLLMLVSAFASYDFTMNAYQTAIKKGYRFFSYGDCMFIL